jgi:hypothetical protein
LLLNHSPGESLGFFLSGPSKGEPQCEAPRGQKNRKTEKSKNRKPERRRIGRESPSWGKPNAPGETKSEVPHHV